MSRFCENANGSKIVCGSMNAYYEKWLRFDINIWVSSQAKDKGLRKNNTKDLYLALEVMLRK